MKKDKKIMDVVFILDRSGSMHGMEKDTIGGYNGYIADFKKKNAKMFHVKQIYILSISSIVYFLIYHNGSLLGSPAFLGYFLGVIFSFRII